MRNIRLIENGVKIGEQVFKIGDIVKAVDENGKTQFKGRVKFGVYLDGEGAFDDYHLGFYVEDIKFPESRWTLIDFVDEWKVIKIKE